MPIKIKRVYEPAFPEDGYRILVYRLWPRGISKEQAKIDRWFKEVAPSDKLRKSFHSGELSWKNFKEKYLLELETNQEMLKNLIDYFRKEQLTLLYSAKNKEKNNALVLKQYLMKLESG